MEVSFKVGFTGTREGMTSEQKEKVSEIFEDMNVVELHHGACEGADEQAHELCSDSAIHIHPGVDQNGNPRWRSACCEDGDVVYGEGPYLERNKGIVDAVEVLIACPKGFEEEHRSGTWHTVRYCSEQGKPCIIVYPDGSTGGYDDSEV